MESDEDFLECLGFTIAFGYYLYLKDGPFKNLRKRIESFEDQHKIELETKKVLILVPHLCYCDITKFEELERLENMQPIEKDVAGIKDRIYTLTVYKLQETNKHYIIDMAQCLDTLQRIKVKNQALGEEQKKFVTEQFIDVLCFLLSNDQKCKLLFEILTFAEGEPFSEVLKNSVLSSKSVTKPRINISGLGNCLAYWVYFNYILLTESARLHQIELWQMKQGVNLAVEKVFLLVPNSCFAPADLIQINDENCIEYAQDYNDSVTAPVVTVGASYKREYKKSVLHVTSKDGEKFQEIYCIAEFATPIRQIYRMFHKYFQTVKELTDQQITDYHLAINEHRDKFVSQLKALLETKTLYTVLDYNDNEDFKLSKFLLSVVGQMGSVASGSTVNF